MLTVVCMTATNDKAYKPVIRSTDGTQFSDDALLRLREAAELLDLSYWTVSRMAARGEFCPDAVKLPNGQWRVKYHDLMQWALSGPK